MKPPAEHQMTIPPEEVSALLVRVKGAKGADREALDDLDAELLDMFYPGSDHPARLSAAAGHRREAKERSFCRSLDAAIALVEWVRPGTCWAVGVDAKGRNYAHLVPAMELGPTPALALITALLESLSDG
jgi:hypothetical protein